jgi:hypothetical protein
LFLFYAGGGLPTVNPGHIKPQQQSAQHPSQSKKFRIRDALGKEQLGPGAALGSPSKSSIEAVRKSYFDVSGGGAVGTDEDWDQEEDALDVNKLREKLQRYE